ncbi:MAG: hypothetical protein AB1673_08500 [Actinomycetota bacterium]|jgi:hypothetical protein
MAEDTTTTDGSCGCCRPEPTTTADVVRGLEARRAAVEERLRSLEPVSAGSR